MSVPNSANDLSLLRMLQKTLDQALSESIKDKNWDIRPCDSMADIEQGYSVVITISSFKFRVITLLHVNLDQQTRQLVADTAGTKLQDLNDTDFIDYLFEMGNSLCGNLKRLLQNTCPPLGMSTPNLLPHASLAFDELLDLKHSAHVTARTSPNEPSLFGASVLVALSHETNFVVDNISYTEASNDFDNSGELELF